MVKKMSEIDTMCPHLAGMRWQKKEYILKKDLTNRMKKTITTGIIFTQLNPQKLNNTIGLI